MNEENLLLYSAGLTFYAFAAKKLLKSKRNRRFKVRPINRRRRQTGNYEYYKTMKKWDDTQFFKYTRMDVPLFEKLLQKIKPSIKKQRRSDGISSEHRLIITLQYLSQGTSMQALAWSFNVGIATIHKIVHESCTAIWNILSPIYLKTPANTEEWLQISKKFEEKWNFPHCIGAIDGKHINIQAPANSGSLYYNYKNRFSTVLLAACDAEYRFILVDIGAYGSQSDGGVLKQSIFGQRLENNSLNVPLPNNIYGCTNAIPYFLVADEAFPLKTYIMRPYPGKNLQIVQKVFNYRLSRARQVIENAFGILVGRWRILKTTINANVQNVDNIVKAVVVLHNYCQTEFQQRGSNMYCPSGYVDSGEDRNGSWRIEESQLSSVGRVGANLASKTSYNIRDTLAEYFLSESGSVSWQMDVINRGRILTT